MFWPCRKLSSPTRQFSDTDGKLPNRLFVPKRDEPSRRKLNAAVTFSRQVYDRRPKYDSRPQSSRSEPPVIVVAEAMYLKNSFGNPVPLTVAPCWTLYS